MTEMSKRTTPEWPTLALLAACYALWGVALFGLAAIWMPAGVVAATVAIALHASLTHEIVHGHPFANDRWNAVLGAVSLGIFVPYARFRDLHLAHHRDTCLTDPYDDPESNYLDPARWAQLPRLARLVLRINNLSLIHISEPTRPY